MEQPATVHLVPQGSATLRAACGRQLGNGHTGHYPGAVEFAAKYGDPYCEACLRIERQGRWSA